MGCRFWEMTSEGHALWCDLVQVSDREYLAGKAGTADRIKHAEQMVKHGQGEDILFRDQGVPVCARRFLSLASKGGDDDMFSSDFTDQDFKVCPPFNLFVSVRNVCHSCHLKPL